MAYKFTAKRRAALQKAQAKSVANRKARVKSAKRKKVAKGVVKATAIGGVGVAVGAGISAKYVKTVLSAGPRRRTYSAPKAITGNKVNDRERRPPPMYYYQG